MEYTRLDTKKLSAAVVIATEHVRLALLALDGMLVNLTDEERMEILRTPVRLPEAARSLARAAIDTPDMAIRAEFDALAVTEDLDNASSLAPLVEKLAVLVRRVDDSRLVWLAEAYVPSLSLYRLAKAGAKVDGSLQSLVDPIGEVFSSRRKPIKKAVETV